MPDKKRRGGSLVQFALIFLLVYLGSQLVISRFFPQEKAPGKVRVEASDITVGGHPVLKVTNATSTGVLLLQSCPYPPVDIFFVEKSGTGTETISSITSSKTAAPCDIPAEAPAGDTVEISMAPWKYSVFGRTGMYEVRVPLYDRSAGTGALTGPEKPRGIDPLYDVTVRFSIGEPGVFTKIFRTFITKPFLNFLIFTAGVLPGHNLGIAIIILTILVKLLLLIPTQHALEGQKKMQMLQPKLDELKHKYPDDAQKVQEETVKLWKEHNVNPFQTCLPTLVQLPILIGLFYVIRDGSVLELSRHLIYPFYQNLSWRFDTSFLGLDLLQPERIFFPIILVVMQFVQMKMSFAIGERKRVKDGKKDAPASAMQMQQKIMLYVLPLMIGVFALQFPAAVSLYWGISTLFGIAQQAYVNREHLKV
ncbi:MAG: YidC/Oxa1 family membrane protein insertase [Candidatus Peribacteraceae bacterium]|nr:YidC/Oxa1 family membrane protein insertase [Candidatus Peribacteraceae bacterium]